MRGLLKLKERYSAVLMSISSLPSEYGIGGFGEETERFMWFIKACGFSALQVLPFNLPDFGNSPYGSCSAFAGNYLYIDPKRLLEDGFITDEEEQQARYLGSPYTVDYSFVYQSKKQIIKRAFEHGFKKVKKEVADFADNNPWVNDYALYMALKEKFDGAAWQKWPNKWREYSSAFSYRFELQKEIDFYLFEQYLFAEQYQKIKKYAEGIGLAVIGDIPIYVAADSVDVWKNPKMFCLDADYYPKEVAGVPPDAFSDDGQLWGNPVYDWDAHESENFAWWLSRLERTFELYDVVRIDHFRGFASYYSIDYVTSDAKKGVWKKGPANKLFDVILNRFERERIIAEDLGTYSEDVDRLLKTTGIRGMRVVQFGFSDGESTHMPHNYTPDCLAYLGTHDNNTLLGWIWDMDEGSRARMLRYCGFTGDDWGKGGFESESCRAVIETVWRSAASIAVIPFQDLCGFGCDARMNIPGISKDNWRFRTTEETIKGIDYAYFCKINQLYFR